MAQRRSLGGADFLFDNNPDTPAATNLFFGGSGSDRLRGGPEHKDIAVYNDIVGPVFVNLATGAASGHGDDALDRIDGVIGSRGGDSLYGSPRSETLDGRGGNDLIIPFAGDDTVAGGEGKDRVSYFAAPATTADLAAGRATGEGTDVLSGIEDLSGGNGHDTLTGDAGPNLIDGGAGTDTCTGGGGADSLIRCP